MKKDAPYITAGIDSSPKLLLALEGENKRLKETPINLHLPSCFHAKFIDINFIHYFGEAIPVCPEQLGGLSTPRLPQEIRDGSGEDVLSGKCKLIGKDGKDTATAQFIRGAEETLKIARLVGATEFIAKSKSPSCGCGSTYDGTFSGTLIAGDGVTTALLKQNGVKVISENAL